MPIDPVLTPLLAKVWTSNLWRLDLSHTNVSAASGPESWPGLQPWATWSTSG